MTRFYPTFGQPRRRFVSHALVLSALLGVAAVVAHGRSEKSNVLRIGLSGPLGSDTEGPKAKAAAAMLQAFIKGETGMNDEIVCQKNWRDLADGACHGSLSTARPSLEVIVSNARQFFDESYDCPDFLVRFFDRAKTRHSGHVDSILDHPEQLLWLALICYLLKVGRIRM